MEITEIRIKLMEGAQDRLLGFCSITFDQAFVIRDLKIIRGGKGPFVAMPSRKLTDRCPDCGSKNHLRAAYCSQCGTRLDDDRSFKTPAGRAKLYADIAHPINSECRELIQQRVLAAYNEEIVLAQRPDYVCQYDEFGDLEDDFDDANHWADEPTTSRIAETSTTQPQHRIDPARSRPPVAGPHRSDPRPSLADKSVGSDEFGEGLF